MDLKDLEKLRWQKKLYETKIWTGCVSEEITDEEFLLVCKGDAYNHWNDNYYCMLEALIAEATI
jgi:hypothetical protein